jgi:hypothetical protein
MKTGNRQNMATANDSHATAHSLWHWPLGLLLGVPGALAIVFYLSLATTPVAVMLAAYRSADLSTVMTFGQFTGLGHVTMYAVLSHFALMVARHWPQRLLLLTCVAGLGLAMEVAQGLSGQRHYETADLFANATGIALAVAGWLVARQWSWHRRIAVA